MEEWLIYQLKYYLSLDKEIALIDSKIRAVSSNYYATHSLIGSSVLLLDSDDYIRSKSVYSHVEEIVSEENALIIRKNKLIRRKKLFNEELSHLEQNRLRIDLFADLDLLKKACNWIQELEYYFNANDEESVNDNFRPTDEMLKQIDQQEEELFKMFGV